MDIFFFALQGIQIYALYLILVAVHEAGHQVVGALVGYRWKGWIIGPLQISRETGPLRFSYSKNWLGGQASAFPHPQDTRTRRTARILGGPLASLLFGLGLFAYFRQLPPDQQDTAWPIMTMMLISLWMVLASLIPYKGYKNDAALLVQLWRDKDKWLTHQAETERYLALTALVASAKAGTRPRDWGDELVLKAVALQDGKTNEATAAHYAFYWAADKGDWEAAGDYMRRTLASQETVSKTYQAMRLLDGAFFEGLICRNSPAARALLTEAAATGADVSDEMQKAMLASMTLRAEAAALLAENQPAEARDKAQEALASLAFAGQHGCGDRCLTECLIAACALLNE